MRVATELHDLEGKTPDYAALRLMLSYVEAECLRIGAADAARHAAMAAAMMPPVEAGLAAAPRRPSGRHLH